MSIKIAHISDNHLGYSTKRRLNEDGVNLRENDGYVAFDQMVTDIIENKVDFVLGGGDIFHTPNPSVRTVLFAQEQLRRFYEAGIPVYLIAGNHEVSDIKGDIASSRLLNDPDRQIFSYVSPYSVVEPIDGVFLHLSSHHLFSEQADTMTKIKPIPGAINIFTTHGTVVDPETHQKIAVSQSPREVVVPDFLLKDNDWSYALFGHIHTRGFVGGKDSKIFYNGSAIRRGFADAEGDKGRGWTLWTISDDGEFSPEFRQIAQRPQFDYPTIDGTGLNASQVSEMMIRNLNETSVENSRIFVPEIAPILRQRLINISPATYTALDWRNINENSKYAFSYDVLNQPKQETLFTANSDNSEKGSEEGSLDSGDIIDVYNTWVKSSQTIQGLGEDVKPRVIGEARGFLSRSRNQVLEETD